MRIALLFPLLIVTVACPVAASAQSATTTESRPGPVKDSWITSKTKMALVADGRTKARKIKVETEGGVVTLRGKVATADERNAAEEITKGIAGVRSVRNTLEVVPAAKRKALDSKDDEISQTVRDRFSNDDQLRTVSIRVRADNGMITLMGTVPTVQAKDHAVAVARKVPGVRGVRNELQLKI
jgi:hyperosmotically inducible periplasmic protein